MRSWRDIFDAEDFGRPTVTKRRFTRFPERELDPWGYKYMGMRDSPGGALPWYAQGEWEEGEEPYYSQQEILDMVQTRFNRLPVSYTTDPATGKVIASKTMPRFETPEEFRGLDVEGVFKRPAYQGRMAGEPEKREPLSFKWVLPKGALTGPEMISRHAPATDPMRQMGYQMGVSGVGAKTSMVNPQTFWPESRFKVPMGQPTKKGLSVPRFGGVMDYTSDRYRFQPPTAWRYGGAVGAYPAEPGELYGAFDPYRPPGTKKRKRFWMGQ